MAECKHTEIQCDCKVAHLETVSMLEVRVHCCLCGQKFQFIGAPMGLNLRGVTTNPNGQELRAAMVPAGTIPPPVSGVAGFAISIFKENASEPRKDAEGDRGVKEEAARPGPAAPGGAGDAAG